MAQQAVPPCERARQRRARCAWGMLLAALLLPHVCSSDVADDADGASGAAEEAHELLRRGSGQVCAPPSFRTAAPSILRLQQRTAASV